MWPIYEFRPLPDCFVPGESWRYADGKWLLDDGETFDLAFFGRAAKGGFAAGLYVDIPYQRNITWAWTTGSWKQNNRRHPRANPWHYALRPGTTEWGGDWGRDRHPNRRAGDAAMRKCCSAYGCANGRGPELTRPNPWIAAGLLRERETGRPVTFPDAATCMYCGDVWTPARFACETV